nr:MAG TPA: Putative TetR-family transcriptional regulator [Bacteriophage sp.]
MKSLTNTSRNRHFWRSAGTAPPALMRQGA